MPAGPCAGGSAGGPDALERGTVARFKDAETEALRHQVTLHTPGTPAAVWRTKAEFCGAQREGSP